MNPLLPPHVFRAITVVIASLGIVMIAVHAVLAALAAQRAPLSERARRIAPFLIAAFLAIWLGTGVMVVTSSNPPSMGAAPRLGLTLLVGFGPLVVAAIALATSGTMRALNAAMPTHWLVWAQSYRMAGLMFLFPFLYYGTIPAGFAWPAAVGDALTGFLALFVGRALIRNGPAARKWAVAWNLFGILDLVVAPVSAVLSHAQVVGFYPLWLVPLFIGPPLGILTHLYSLRNLAVAPRMIADSRNSAGARRVA